MGHVLRTGNSVKTDDSIALYNSNYYKVDSTDGDQVTLTRMLTADIEGNVDYSTPICLPWSLLSVKLYLGTITQGTVTVSKSVVKAKGILCGEILTPVYPKHILT